MKAIPIRYYLYEPATIDNFHNLIAISYDYLLVCIFYILGKKHSFFW